MMSGTSAMRGIELSATMNGSKICDEVVRAAEDQAGQNAEPVPHRKPQHMFLSVTSGGEPEIVGVLVEAGREARLVARSSRA